MIPLPCRNTTAKPASHATESPRIGNRRASVGYDSSELIVDTQEAAWIEAAKRGDRDGFDALVRRHQSRLYFSLQSILGCPTLAEDVLQDAWVKAFAKLHQFRSNSNFYTWVYRIALNSRRRYFRAVHQTASLDRMYETDVAPQSDGATPEALLQQQETLVQVRRALAKLGDRQREILELREFDRMDYQEIGDRLGVPVGTVRSRLSRARAELRHLLRDANGG